MPNQRRVAVAVRIDEPYAHHQKVLAGVHKYAREHPEWQYIIDEHPGLGSIREPAAERGSDPVSSPGTGKGDRPRRFSKRDRPAYDGVIARATPEMQRRLKRLQIPLVNVWYQQARPGVVGVYCDAKAAGRLAAEHLLDRGIKRLTLIGMSGSRSCKATGRAFYECAGERGAACQIEAIETVPLDDSRAWLALRGRLEKILDGTEVPAGIFVTDSSVARLLATQSLERGWRIAQQLGLICFNDVKGIVESPPQLSSIDSNDERVGYEAAKLLDQLMAGAPVPKEPLFVPPKGVIARESTDYFAVEDELVAAALRYVSTRLREELSVERIAAAVGASPRLLQRQFQVALGRPISDEIRRLRLLLAKRLLGEARLPIGQIASEAGFNSAENFCRAFQREVGTSPSDYRKQVRGERAGER